MTSSPYRASYSRSSLTSTNGRTSRDYTMLYSPSGPLGSTVEEVEAYMERKSIHRNRFLNDTERLVEKDVDKTRESMDTLENQDGTLWHLQPIPTLLQVLNTCASRGLTPENVILRKIEYGPNVLKTAMGTPVHILFLLQFNNLIVVLLITAALASVASGEVTEGCVILFIVTLNAVIATYQEYSASNSLEALAKLSSPHCMVTRDGKQTEICSEELVPGDLVQLVTGDVVPADIRLITSSDFKVNEMLLTGESEDVAKSYDAKVAHSTKLTADNMIFSSCTVSGGNATGFVVETGMCTKVGSIATLLQGGEDATKKRSCISKYQPKLTPLQQSLHRLGVVMGAFALMICVLVFIMGMVLQIEDAKHPEKQTYLVVFILCVSLVVSAVPEGLPMVVTICLSGGTSDMVKKNVLVRKLAAVETLGAASVICTDKTGTLTEGKMTAVKLWGDFNEYDITGKGFTPEGDILSGDVSQIAVNNVQVRSTLLSAVLCSNTKLVQEEDIENKCLKWIPMGNSSEAPLIVAAAKAGIWGEYVHQQYPRVFEIPFSSSRKMMITVTATPSGFFDALELPLGTKYVAHVKGAPNYILTKCAQYVSTDGTIKDLKYSQRKTVDDVVDDLSSQALRVLAVAIQPLTKLPYSDDADMEEQFQTLSSPLILLGLFASIDPAREGVKLAIAKARHASIRTVMITGDYLKTAVAIAKNIDLLQVNSDPDEEATDCSILRHGDQYICEPDLDEITSRTCVFARAQPADKVEIVKSLQRQGMVVAMTGDGVNDAPALKEADIGIAMGISGTEVAKGASDMILMDDNFCSIVSGIEKGRVIYSNVQKFVTFLLSTNIGEIFMITCAFMIGLPIPLEPLQIIILNLFTDGLPAVALSLENGDPILMNERPRPMKQNIIHGRLWLIVLLNALFLAASAFSVYLIGLSMKTGTFIQDNNNIDINAIEQARTMTFVCITIMEVFRAYAVRSFTAPIYMDIFGNVWMQRACVATIVLTLLVTNVPGVMSVFGFAYIQYYDYLIAIGIAFNNMLFGEFLKFVLRCLDYRASQWAHMNDRFDELLMEIRNARHHVEHLEDRLQLTSHRPGRRLTSC